MSREKRKSIHKRNLLISAIMVGSLAATPAFADDEDDDRGGRPRHGKTPISTQENPKEPIQVRRRTILPNNSIEFELVTVPSGKRLIMQYVSMQATTSNAGDLAFNVFCRIDVESPVADAGPDPRLDLVVTTTRNKGLSGLDDHLAGGPITFYAEPGDVVSAGCNAVPEAAELTSLSVTLVGYYAKVHRKDDGYGTYSGYD